MATYTTRLAATKPASSENVDVTTLNNDFDLFDAAAGATVGASSARPASAFNGRMFYATDSAKLYVNTAANASTAASWADPVANGFGGNISIGGSLTVANGVTITAGKGAKTLLQKSSATGRASTTTVASDPHLTTTIAASAVYALEAHLYVSGSAGGDVKIGWTGAPAATERHVLGPALTTTDAADGNMRARWHNWSTGVGYGLDGSNDSYITEGGLIDNTGAAAATLALQWAQNTSVAASTVMGSNSYVILERLT